MRTPRVSSKTVLPLIVPALSLLVSAVYWQVGGHSFIHLDDSQYVAKNQYVLRGLTWEGIGWAFTTFTESNWHPLTWLSHMIDVEYFGLDAGWHHRVNALIHLANTELLFLVLFRMTGGMWQSAFVAALFGVHPLHVESVAWVAERKDVLSTLFWMLTMGAYLRYVAHPGVGRYLVVVASFTLGLLCKPMLVTLPFVLLLLDWWPLRRFGEGPFSLRSAFPRLREKIPLLSLSAASCVVTYQAQSRDAVVPLVQSTIGLRISNTVVSYAAYLGKAIWPASLAILYPHPSTTHSEIPAGHIFGALFLLGGLSFLAWRWRNRRPYIAMGWMWYLGTLVPVIGLVQVGMQAYADRYTYVPLIGVFIAIAWGAPEALGGWRLRKHVLVGIGGGLVLATGISAWNQAGYWRDSITLFTRTLKVTEKNWLILANLGAAYDDLGQPRQAIASYREALRIKPDDVATWNNLGKSYGKLGQYQQAIGSFQEALRIRPDYTETWNNLGKSYGKLGQYQQAIGSFQEALRIKPDDVDAWSNLGISYNKLGQYQQAIGSFQEALRIKPDHADAWSNLGLAYEMLGQYQRAIGSIREALRIKPDDAETWNNLGVSYGKLGQYQQAIGSFQEALRIKPDHADAWSNLGLAYEMLGQYQQAIGSFREALRITPDSPDARNNLARANGKLGQSR